MTRSELEALVGADNPKLRHAEIELIIETIFGSIAEVLAAGGRVEIRGFGSFNAKSRKGRIGRNPKTGEAVAVTPKAVPAFRAGKGTLRRLNPAETSTEIPGVVQTSGADRLTEAA
jgi:integration host factor subunit beta